MSKELYLIDATGFCYRAFFALPPLTTSSGQPTNAVFGFINILNKILKDRKPGYLAVCFDVSRDTFRAKRFAEYKIQRPPTPEGLTSQFPLVKELIRAYGIALFEKEGFEADDVIATLSEKAKKAGFPTVIVSSDKDILQVVDDNTQVFSPYKDEGVLYDARKVRERFGVEPERIADIIALMGDSADNIPGIPGIGEKTATSLIQEFGSLDNLLENLGQIKSEKVKKSIRENLKQLELNRELVRLDTKVDIDFEPESLKLGEPDTAELYRLFKRLEFKKLLKGLQQPEEASPVSQGEEISGKDLEKEIASGEELYLYVDDSGKLIFSLKDRLFVPAKGAALKKILEDEGIRKISHDLKKAKVALAAEGLALAGLYFDTMIAAYLLDPSKSGYGLDDVSWEHLGEPAGLKGAHQESALGFIRKLKPKLEKELKEKELSGLFRDLEMPLVEVLAEMELNGIKLDHDLLKKISTTIEKRLIELIDEIYGLSGTQFNINSPKQLRDILFEKLKLPVVKRTKTGPSTDEEVLKALAAKHKLPGVLLEYRQLTKLKNTYVDTLPEMTDKTGRLHTSFNQTGTETGRLSSSNPNLQNIPVKTEIGGQIRRSIIASEKDNYLLSCDYSQIELRILAHLSSDEDLIRAFKQDKDIHKATAALIYGVEEKEVSDPMRETAKRVNFGIIYGLTSYGLSRDLGISVDEAERFIDAYFLRYPKVKDYIEGQIKLCRKQMFVTTLLGRRRYIPQINEKSQALRQFAERQAVNTPIQGTAADLIKLAMVQIQRGIREKGLRAQMVLQIHDELLFDAPKEELREAVVFIRERMENVLKLAVPVKVEIKKGKNWLEMEEVK
ncbi:MAG: DNA polymerase I [Candidatus Omnitrophica bacterium]|nr:DNA polymerase I [Candidatus Omnitrophota bacterium]